MHGSALVILLVDSNFKGHPKLITSMVSGVMDSVYAAGRLCRGVAGALRQNQTLEVRMPYVNHADAI